MVVKDLSTSYENSSDGDGTVKIEGYDIIPNLIYEDGRGIFQKFLSFVDLNWLCDFPIKQVNFSRNIMAGTMRGLHYQSEPFLEWKIVSCIKGSAFDVVLDMRPMSKTFGKWTSHLLTPTSGSVIVPPQVAHGFQTLEDETQLLYLHSAHYSETHNRTVSPLDSHLNINWPLPVSVMSDADRDAPKLNEVKIDDPKV